jgi:hypothetical protein
MRNAATAHRAICLAVCLTTIIGGCDSHAPSASVAVPIVLERTMLPSTGNVMSARIFLRSQFAESVAVRYGLAGGRLDSVTPPTRVRGDTATVSLLGLLADRTYELQPVLYGNGHSVAAAVDSFATDSLPADVPAFVASGADPSAGFVVFATQYHGVVIDNTGRVVWYKRFESGAGLGFMPTGVGTFVAKPVTAARDDIESWIEFDVNGRELRSMPCANGLVSRPHDIIVLADRSYWLMCDDVRTMDLRVHGGASDARVTGTAVQHVDAEGRLLFQWTPFDHFDIADLDPSLRSMPNVNWTHGNAITLDTDGNIVVSFRNLSEVTKIDTRTGNVLWRLGGARNQFALSPATSQPFFRQHGVRVGAGEVFLLDNLGEGTTSRVERYSLSPAARTASLVRIASPVHPLVGSLGGSVQRLPGDRLLVSYGNGAHVVEYDANGSVVWRIEGNPGYVFHAQRIRSLYPSGQD